VNKNRFPVHSSQISVRCFPVFARTVALVLCCATAARGADGPATGTRPAETPTPPAVAEPRPILSPARKLEHARRVIDRFVAHVRGAPDVPASARSAVERGWREHRNDEDPSEFLTAGVAIVREAYKNAMQAMDQEDFAAAEALLRPLAGDKDVYVALHAGALLARTLVEQEKLEEAEELLAPLAAREKELIECSFLEAEVDFLLAYCRLANLRYEEARASLQSFENQHPDAPERLRLPARQMLQELAARQPESLGEVSDLMDYARRRLSTGRADKPVRQRQDRAIELLDKLIMQAEERENQQNQNQDQNESERDRQQRQRQQQNQPNGGNRSNTPMQDSRRPQGRGGIGELHRSATAKPGEEWGKMPPEERERILQSLRRNFPSQYRQLVEQYYKQLAKEK